MFNLTVRKYLIICNAMFALLFMGSSHIHAGETNKKVLFHFDNGLQGWKRKADVNGYGAVGWQYEDGSLGSSDKFPWGNGPRMFNKGDYGKENDAIIDNKSRAPSSLSGASLKIFDTDLALPGKYQTTWWLWYDGRSLSERGVTTKDTNRASIYIKIDGLKPLSEDNGVQSIINNFHVGTYLCWYREDGKPAYGRGDGCPYEGVGNQHYYHYFSFYPGAWIKVLLDEHPQHLRSGGSYKITGNNPSHLNHGKDYFQYLHQFYMEIRAPQANKTSMNIDDVYFYQETEPQNETSITSLWVGYWYGDEVWRLGFNDMTGNCDNCVSTFEIKWSDKPITNENYGQANTVTPLLYSGEKFSSYKNGFRRANFWKSNVYTKFKIDNIPDGTTKVYFAVKDVSIEGEHKGSKWPWNKADKNDAASTKIKTISYDLIPSSKRPDIDQIHFKVL